MLHFSTQADATFLLRVGSEQTSSVREGKRPDVGNPYPVFRYDRTLSEEGLLGAHVWTGGFRSICVDFMGYLIADEEGSAYAQKIRGEDTLFNPTSHAAL